MVSRAANNLISSSNKNKNSLNKDNNSDSTSSIGLNKKKKLNQIENKENINFILYIK